MVWMPSSRAARLMRTAISARLARSRRLIKMLDLDLGQGLAGHDGILVVDQELHDLAGDIGLHLVEALHHLDEADHLAGRDLVAVRLVDRLVRRRLAVEGAGERREDLLGRHFHKSPCAALDSSSSCLARGSTSLHRLRVPALRNSWMVVPSTRLSGTKNVGNLIPRFGLD